VFETYRVVDLNDSEGFEALAEAVREWEPRLDLMSRGLT
jgi:hypothetical protein